MTWSMEPSSVLGSDAPADPRDARQRRGHAPDARGHVGARCCPRRGCSYGLAWACVLARRADRRTRGPRRRRPRAARPCALGGARGDRRRRRAASARADRARARAGCSPTDTRSDARRERSSASSPQTGATARSLRRPAPSSTSASSRPSPTICGALAAALRDGPASARGVALAEQLVTWSGSSLHGREPRAASRGAQRASATCSRVSTPAVYGRGRLDDFLMPARQTPTKA